MLPSPSKVPLEYAGTYLNNGVPINSSSCINGYANAGFVSSAAGRASPPLTPFTRFVIGSSAALFSTYIATRIYEVLKSTSVDAIQSAGVDSTISTALTTLGDDLADVSPLFSCSSPASELKTSHRLTTSTPPSRS